MYQSPRIENARVLIDHVNDREDQYRRQETGDRLPRGPPQSCHAERITLPQDSIIQDSPLTLTLMGCAICSGGLIAC
jgi:hypothetical protein